MAKTRSGNRAGNRGRGSNFDVIDSLRERPYAAAAAAAGVAAAGAFLWARRSQIGEALSSGMDSLSEFKSQRMGNQSPSEIAEEALTLKESGAKSNQERKAGAKAYS